MYRAHETDNDRDVAVKLFRLDLPPERVHELVGQLQRLIALGVSLSRLKVQSFGRSLALSLMRLGLGLAIGWGLAVALGFEGAARGVLILQCAMPTAVMNYIVAMRFDRNPGEVAGVIVASTTISFATLPLLLWVVL